MARSEKIDNMSEQSLDLLRPLSFSNEAISSSGPIQSASLQDASKRASQDDIGEGVESSGVHQAPVLWQWDPSLPGDIIDVLQECKAMMGKGQNGWFYKSQVVRNLVAKDSPGQYHFRRCSNLSAKSTMRQFTLFQLGLTQDIWEFLDGRHREPPRPPSHETHVQRVKSASIEKWLESLPKVAPMLELAPEKASTPHRPECDELRTLSPHTDDAKPCTSGRHPHKTINVCSQCYTDHVHRHLFLESSQKQRQIMEFQTFLPLCEPCGQTYGAEVDGCQCFDHTRMLRCRACFESDVLALTGRDCAESKATKMQQAVNRLATGARSRSGNLVLSCALCSQPADPDDKARWCIACENILSCHYYTNILGSEVLYEATCAPPGWEKVQLVALPDVR